MLLVSGQDRAVIKFTDALTLAPRTLDREVVDALAEHLDEEQIAELVLVIATASALNRIVLFSRHLRAVAAVR